MSKDEDYRKLLDAMAFGPAPQIARDKVELEEGGYVIVSTVDTIDRGLETAILCNVDGVGETRPMRLYQTPDEAVRGHEEVVADLKRGVRLFQDLGYGSSQKSFEFVVEGRGDVE